MPAPVRDHARHTSRIAFTPPTGSDALGGRTRPRPTRPRIAWRALAAAEPTPAHFAIAAVLYWSVPWLLARLEGIHLPHDRLFSAVLYLMWSGNPEALQRVGSLFMWATWLHLAAAATLLASALLPKERMFAPVHTVGRRLYRYAIALPLWTVLAAHLARLIGNQVYALAGTVSWDLTPAFARLEAPLIEGLQHALASPAMSAFASTFYSAIWLAVMAFAGFVLVAMDRPKAMDSLIVSYVLACVLVLPLLVLLPTFDPWTTNALYGATGVTTQIRYLYPNPSLSLLTQVNTGLHWSAGSAFPSMHVGLPLVIGLMLRKHGMRVLSYVMMGMAATTAFVVVYLGRHWIIDAVAAVPFALGVVALSNRIPMTVIVGPRSAPVAAAAPDPAMDGVQWLSAVFFLSGFAALLYQVVWQRTLFGIIGLNIESVTLVVTAFMLGLGTGSLVGGAISRRAAAQLPLLFAAAEVAIGVFGFFSMSVFQYVGHATLAMSSTATATTTFLTLLPPTILMGATLPLLVMHQVRVERNVGEAVGRLYFTNTLGSAAAAGVAALLLLGHLGQEATVQCAAAVNVGVGLLVYARTRRSGGTL